MTRFFAAVLTCSILNLLAHPAFSQQDSVRILIDSAFRTPVLTTPYFTRQPMEEYGTYSARVADPALSQAYAGINVFNTLRGQVPSLAISPSVVYAESASIRSAQTMILIDGMPFASDASSVYNLNAFDFESVTAVANPNTNFNYGAAGLQGGFFLKSKTGENLDRPAFEFNSYTSRNISYEDPVFYEPGQSTWNLSNSFAYSQDYGAVDLRASYNFTSDPFPTDGMLDGYNRAHSMKINGGLDLGKFSLRFIGDYRSQNWQQEPNFNPTGAATIQEGHIGLLQGNLLAQYKFNDWLKITSQNISSTTEMESDNRSSLGDVNFESDQPRRLHNLIVAINKPVSADFTLRSFAGIQYDRSEWTRMLTDYTSNSEQHYEQSNTGLFAGIGAGIAEAFFVDVNYRRDAFSLFPDDKPVHTWGASASIIFSRLFLTDDAGFYGKIRSYLGRSNNDYVMNYPAPAQNLIVNRPPYSPRNNFEIGLDVGVMQNRLTFSTSYYKNVEEDAWAQFNSPYTHEYFDLGELHYSGYEFVAGFLPVITPKTRWSSKIIFFRNKTEIVSESANADGDDFNLGSSIPDWKASWLNQFSYGPVFVNVLLEIRKGGDVYLYDHMQTPMGIIDGSHTKFRDISLGYSFAHSLLERMNLESARISLSGRNLIQFNDKDEDAERYDVHSYLKSISFSLSLGF